ncbi:chorismate mutase [Azospirillum rugosum]|uniref:chorismate mutase n=1 Tax=Azospirillum rugosum TaxID=416170 RepID=A0ABS4SGR6_9PROT|nr:chorismate mutase [Azospirillum rugosum]MBP2291702.1 chorismate mutase-like protein [Azospirillum rugosum]MDQ0524486.1 chorismate mutase-like protein [Azospirillum rugosum]
MPAPKSPLDDLRREIDHIDDAIHDLLMRRAAVVERIGAVKAQLDDQNGAVAAAPPIFLRPAREAVILRRLMARHAGSFPAAAVVRMWREMITALTRIQGPFAVAVYAPEERRGFWDVARDHFGSFVSMTAVNTPAAAIRAVSEGTATVGVVPYPAEDDADPWWRFLLSSDARTPRVVARLPFGGRGNARGEDRDALAIALVPHEPTGDDRTLLAIELGHDLSRGRLKDHLEHSGLAPTGFCTWHAKDPSGPSLHLVEIADFVDHADPRLSAFAERLAEIPVRVNIVGGYAVPLHLSHDARKV